MQSSTALILLVILERETLISCKTLSKGITIPSRKQPNQELFDESEPNLRFLFAEPNRTFVHMI